MDDKAAKGREADKRGEKNGRSKLTMADVERVKQMRIEGMSQQAIANEVGVSQVAISALLRGKTWNCEF